MLSPRERLSLVDGHVRTKREPRQQRLFGAFSSVGCSRSVSPPRCVDCRAFERFKYQKLIFQPCCAFEREIGRRSAASERAGGERKERERERVSPRNSARRVHGESFEFRSRRNGDDAVCSADGASVGCVQRSKRTDVAHATNRNGNAALWRGVPRNRFPFH